MSARWAVICGLVRDEAAMAAKIETLTAWRAQGVIEGIVFSTWLGELGRYPAIRKALNDFGAHVVELPEPRLKTVGHVIHQAKAIYYGLQAAPEGAMILKLRPDIGGPTDDVRDTIVDVDLTLSKNADWPEIFRRKVVCNAYSPDTPFYINDMIYYGLREDLLKLASFDLSTEYLCAHTAPEQFFFRGAMAFRFPLLEAYLPTQMPFIYGDRERGQLRIDTLLNSDFYLDVIAHYLTLMRHYFKVGFVNDTIRALQNQVPDGFDIAEAFGPSGSLAGVYYHPAAWATTFLDEQVQSAILDRRFADNPLGRRMNAALDRVSDPAYWTNFPSNPLRPHAAVAELHQALKENFSELSAKLGIQDDAHKPEFEIRGELDRVGLVGQDDETRRLAEEVNRLRRTIDDLTAQKSQA